MNLRTLFWLMTVACVAIFTYMLSLELVSPEFDWRRSDQGRSGKYIFSFAVAFSVAVFVGIAPAVYRDGRARAIRRFAKFTKK
jgi:hypothetical protein